jgi:hypothetical protein
MWQNMQYIFWDDETNLYFIWSSDYVGMHIYQKSSLEMGALYCLQVISQHSWFLKYVT